MTPGILRLLTEQSLGNINTVRVACVKAFKQEANGAPYVEVQPCIYSRGEQLPILVRVPVVYPMSSSGQSGIAFSLRTGDYVVLLFNQESLDEWLSFGGDRDPHDIRVFDLSDAIAVPGIIPLNHDFISLDTTDYVCVGDVSSTSTGLRLEISPTGKIKLGDGTNDVLKVLSDLLSTLSTTLVATSLGPQPLSTVAQMGALKTQIDLIRGAT